MKTTKQKLINLVITMSVTINLVMLGGLGYLATLDNQIENSWVALNSPVVVYIPKALESSDVKKTLMEPLATH
jgi:hypothetical protein